MNEMYVFPVPFAIFLTRPIYQGISIGEFVSGFIHGEKIKPWICAPCMAFWIGLIVILIETHNIKASFVAGIIYYVLAMITDKIIDRL